jgi:sulfur relay protein TusB/DsrH
MITYLIGRSPFREHSIRTTIATAVLLAQNGEKVRAIFLQDGVIVAIKGNQGEDIVQQLSQAGVDIFYRTEDLTARGIDTGKVTDIGQTIDTQEIMAILADSSSIVSLL